MSRRRSRTRNWSLVVGVGVVGLILGYLIGTAGRQEPGASDRDGRRAVAPQASAVEPAPVVVPSEPVPPSSAIASEPVPPPLAVPVAVEMPPIPRGDGTRIALVIDDLGRRVQDVVDLSELGVPLSFGVLPFESHTSDVLAELGRRGGEVLLHLPMQPLNEADPGPGALTSGMNADQLEAGTRWALEAVEVATGVNNHMGSELSADAARMRTILGVLAEHGLFFLDSKTSPHSVGYSLALEMGMAAAERQVFLDTEASEVAIRLQFRRLLAVARERGSAVAIGHPYAETLAVLREEVPLAQAAGFEFVPVSSVTRRIDAANLSARASEHKASTGLD